MFTLPAFNMEPGPGEAMGNMEVRHGWPRWGMVGKQKIAYNKHGNFKKCDALLRNPVFAWSWLQLWISSMFIRQGFTGENTGNSLQQTVCTKNMLFIYIYILINIKTQLF